MLNAKEQIRPRAVGARDSANEPAQQALSCIKRGVIPFGILEKSQAGQAKSNVREAE